LGADSPDYQPTMLVMDDPDHKRLRGLVSKAFNQRSVDAWRPRPQRSRGLTRVCSFELTH